jgi:hypothetical protein
VALGLPEGIAAVVVADPADQLDTAIVWRKDDPSPANEAFRSAAEAAFANARSAHTQVL